MTKFESYPVLFTPGPTSVAPFAQQRMNQPLHHRSREFRIMMERIQQRLQWLFQTHQPVLLLTSSATGAAEAAMINVFPHPSKQLVVVNGKFAERWAQMLQRFGHQVIIVDVPWGDAPLLEDIQQALKKHSDIAGFWIVHSETSTGVLLDLKNIATLVHHYSDALICVDAVSSLAVHPVAMDQWHLDIVFTGSQKALMLPPGLALLALSQRAWNAVAKQPSSWYFDLQQARQAAEQSSTPWTPALSIIQGLDAVLDYFEQLQLSGLWQLHRQRAHAFRHAAEAMGLRIFGQASSHALTPLYLPPIGVSIVEQLYRQFGIAVAGGQGSLKDKIFRISHIGWLPYHHQLLLISALEQILYTHHYRFPFGAGVATFQRVWLEEQSQTTENTDDASPDRLEQPT